MNLERKAFKANQMYLDSELYDDNIIPIKFAEKILSGEPGQLSSKFWIDGYSYKSKGTIMFYLRMINKDEHDQIDLVLTGGELIALYHLISSIREGFAKEYTLTETDSGTTITIKHAEKYVVCFSNEEGKSMQTTSSNDTLLRRVLFLLHFMLTCEPKTYRSMLKSPDMALAPYVNRKSLKDDPKHILASREFQHYAKVLGYNVTRIVNS